MLYAIAFAVILLASFLFAMLGLGGGMVYVPVLKWAGFPVKEVAIPLGLLMNGLNTLLALIPFSRQKLVDWKGGLVMAAAAFIFAPAGAYLSQFVPADALIIAFAVAVLAAAIRMLFFAKQSEPEEMMAMQKRSIIGGGVGAFAGSMRGALAVGAAESANALCPAFRDSVKRSNAARIISLLGMPVYVPPARYTRHCMPKSARCSALGSTSLPLMRMVGEPRKRLATASSRESMRMLCSVTLIRFSRNTSTSNFRAAS